MRVYKFGSVQSKPMVYSLPVGAKPLKAGVQNGEVVFWAAVDDHRLTEDWEVVFVGTGRGVPEPFALENYVDTAIDPEGFVWHVFARKVAP